MTTMESQATATTHGRDRPVVTLVTALVALAAWLVLFWHVRFAPGTGGVHSHHTMASLTDPGVPEAIALTSGVAGIGLYLLMWGTMMVAMMYPSSARMFQLYADSLPETTTGRRVAGVTLFVATYTLVWTGLGVVPLAVNAVVPIAELDATAKLAFLGGTLVVLAAYQLSPAKRRCLYHCRYPQQHAHRTDGSGPIRQSLHLTLADVGSCWLLMGVMVVVGSMNLLWMAAVTVVLSLERIAPDGVRLARAFAVVSGIAGLALLASVLLAAG